MKKKDRFSLLYDYRPNVQFGVSFNWESKLLNSFKNGKKQESGREITARNSGGGKNSQEEERERVEKKGT